MGGRADRWHEPKRDYLNRVKHRTGLVFELEGRGARWASGPAGAIGILASGGTQSGGRWWLGVDEIEFRNRRALGLILLCQSRDELLDFGLSRDKVAELLSQLGRDRERKLNLVHRHDRYVIQVPGHREVDVTQSLGDLSWLDGDRSMSATEPRAVDDKAPHLAGPETGATAFFARVRAGLLEPLDPTGLPEGAVVAVRATVTHSTPQVSALRRILAAGGPDTLPRDLAERHDHYAHGARKA